MNYKVAYHAFFFFLCFLFELRERERERISVGIKVDLIPADSVVVDGKRKWRTIS